MGCISGEVDYDEVTSDVAVTATGFTLTELMRVTVPSLPFPVWLEFWLWAAADVSTASLANPINTKATAGILPAAALGPTAALSAIASDRYGKSNATTPGAGATVRGNYSDGLPTEADGGPVLLAAAARLGPNSPGDYVVGGVAAEGLTRLWHMIGDDLFINRFVARRGR